MKSTFQFVAALLLALAAVPAIAQTALWQPSQDRYSSYFNRAGAETLSLPESYAIYNLNGGNLATMQAAIPMLDLKSDNFQGIPIQLPLPDGSMFTTLISEVNIWENPVMADKVETKTYRLMNTGSKAVDGSVSILNGGISAILFTAGGTVYIHPLNVDASGAHVVYFVKDVKVNANYTCSTEGEATSVDDNLAAKTTAGDCRRRNYRLAVGATGEYTTWAGGVTQARNYITISINTVNAIYLRDLGASFVLIQNDAIIYTNAASDPYSSTLSGTFLNNNQTALDGNVGSANYDVGIGFSAAFSGGLAQLQSACANSEKARAGVGHQGGTGANPNPGPQGQWFDGAVAHEIGHMFGATHTFSATNGACGSNITLSSAWEPGSGSTIMAYAAAGCGPTNAIQTYQDYYFHGGSIGQMQSYIVGATGTCGSPTVTTNVAPVITTPVANTTIPKSTPFMLTLNAFDANGNALTYSWEQMDAGYSSSNPPSATQTQGPLFRSYPPSTSPTRYFPMMESLNGSTTFSPYEKLPSIARQMNFRGTVRDNSTLGGCTAENDVTITVASGAGPFMVTSQWGPETWTANGTNTTTITWDVANTSAAPVNAATVDILFSLDGGYTYPVILAAATPNDGSQTITIPVVATTDGRIMVKATNNIFFNINDAAITVVNTTPVTFLNVSAVREGETARINWSTAMEQNNEKFVIERSATGSEFTEIGSVKGAGNSTSVNEYSFVDAQPFAGLNYYRIKQVDLDGRYSHTKVVSVNMSHLSATTITSYPNPVKDVVNIEIKAVRAEKVTLELFDSKGARVMRRSINAMAGTNNTTLNLSTLGAGVYILKTSSQSLNATSRLVKE